MKNGMMCWATMGLVLGAAAVPLAAGQAPAFTGPVELRVDNLKTPLGIDDPAPRLSWQLWESGRIELAESVNVRYAGPALQASTRYFWRVRVWDAAGKVYAESETSWWETGLLKQDGWRARWIGYETAEEDAVRHAAAAWITNPDARALAAENRREQHFAYRAAMNLDKPVLRAALYATGQDTVSAWINGEQVLTAGEFMAWKKFVRADITGKLTAGVNAIAIETVHFVDNPSGAAAADAPPMIATLVVEYADGSTADFVSGREWKTAVHLAPGWEQKGFDDSDWSDAVEWQQAPGPRSQPLGHPWIPDSVKTLRRTFTVSNPVKSARLYA